MAVLTSVLSAERKNLRACLLCGIILSYKHFLSQGCPNCEMLLQISASEDSVQECTSPIYEGVLAVMQPTESWVAKWQRINRFVGGVYAIRVQGRLPEEIIEQLDRRNVQYRPRDGTVDD
ncbi:hypothetical protein T552_03449 [Pneumocystis carinii B80]|uniref:Transcription elongation factor SPT4 n=1 Tax=Pneumocystis carinii (strain B80) TaxID=1408658 RepID=A0A0W4ZAU8_PNEC8|nr:hypothetical protein T552_03449 [Pneumocystis carinii B80]KTW25588.1 hypothetical protein T552_03449 [Pneumocystis carinii B80]